MAVEAHGWICSQSPRTEMNQSKHRRLNKIMLGSLDYFYGDTPYALVFYAVLFGCVHTCRTLQCICACACLLDFMSLKFETLEQLYIA